MLHRVAPLAAVLAIGVIAGIAGSGCGVQVSEVRTGLPHGSRPADCALELSTLSAGDMAPGARFGDGGQYETVGMVVVGAPAGTSPFADDVKAAVRPHACAMGGKIVTLLANGAGARQGIAFQVWGDRSPGSTSQLTIPY